MWSRLELLESEMKEKYIPTEHENVNKYRSQYNNKDVHMNYIMYNYTCTGFNLKTSLDFKMNEGSLWKGI